ncbi:MAG TPA: hypothetical protein VMW19_07235 [Myxococcota bacterium]|nr:hypothetical protein [Myxococcota bacterium]
MNDRPGAPTAEEFSLVLGGPLYQGGPAPRDRARRWCLTVIPLEELVERLLGILL